MAGGIVTVSIGALSVGAVEAFVPRQLHQSKRVKDPVSLFQRVAAAVGLGLAAVTPAVSVSAGPAWKQGLTLVVLGCLFTVFRFTVSYGQSYSSGSGFSSGYLSGFGSSHGFGSGWGSYSFTETTVEQVSEPFMSNLVTTALALVAAVWLSARLEVGLDLDGWVGAVLIVVLVNGLLTTCRRLIPPTVTTTVGQGFGSM